MKQNDFLNFSICKAYEISKIIINCCVEMNVNLNIAKLQKLLVLVQGESLAISDKPLFNETILALPCGLAVKEVSIKFNTYNFDCKDKFKSYIILSDFEKKIIYDVLLKYGNKDAYSINSDYRLKKLFKMFYVENKYNFVPINAIKKVFSKFDLLNEINDNLHKNYQKKLG